jgi:hypothetical protein
MLPTALHGVINDCEFFPSLYATSIHLPGGRLEARCQPRISTDILADRRAGEVVVSRQPTLPLNATADQHHRGSVGWRVVTIPDLLNAVRVSINTPGVARSYSVAGITQHDCGKNYCQHK